MLKYHIKGHIDAWFSLKLVICVSTGSVGNVSKSGVLFTGLDIMMQGHHLEHLRGEMKTSQRLSRRPPHLPLRPAMLHQVSITHQSSP